jgi:hypothetical protein
MAFVNEIIPEADKQRIDWSKFKAYSYSKPHNPWKWTIDRQRNIFLIVLSQVGFDDTGTRPDVYAFFWKEIVIRFEAITDGNGRFDTGVDMYWTISNIEIPFEFESGREEIINTLREAIDSYGATYKRDVVKSVHIVFS